MIRNEIMSKVYGKVLKNLLVISGVLLAIYLFAQLILNVFGLQFRAKINVWWLGITFVLFIIGIIQLCNRRKSKKLIFSVVISISILVLLCFNPEFDLIVISLLEQIPHKEYILVIDGYKFVGYEDDSWDVFIDFYDYKNKIVSGSEKRFRAYGYTTDENGNRIFYDENHNYERLEDIYAYTQGKFTTEDLTLADN